MQGSPLAAEIDRFARAAVPVEERMGARVRHVFPAGAREVVTPTTFTPFASATPCTARCTFCSETLRPASSTQLSAQLRPSASYGAQLRACLGALGGLRVGLSLSGLEATSEPAWLCDVLDATDEHARGTPWLDAVLYTNASGLSPKTTGAALVPRLARAQLTRVEISRHAVDERANDAIMRFREDVAVRANDAFRDAVRFVGDSLAVRLVCVAQQGGVFDLATVRGYLAWARDTLGVRDVVFRELSRITTGYTRNATLRLVDHARVSIESLTSSLGDEFAPVGATRGYYFGNVRFRWRDVLVTFESSDYDIMKRAHASDVVHKLVFHANGNLCADWDPAREILAHFA